jgi:hypothetical protein
MAIVTNKITIHKGNPYSATFIIKNADGTAYDLTGKTLFFTVKELDDFTDTDSTALIQADVTEFTDAINGIANVEIPASDTLLDAGFYKWDIRIYEMEESSGELPVQMNSLTGQCEVKDVVTKRIS